MSKPTAAPIALSPLSITRMLWKRKILILAAWIALSGITVVYVQQLPPVYVADTLILVDSQKIPEKYVSSTVSTDLQDRLMTINQQILSSTRLQKIIDDFGLYTKEKKTMVQEEILEQMRRDISVTIEAQGTNNRPGAFRIGYQGNDPNLVAQVANRIANLYIEENLKTREVQAQGTTEFMENQLTEAKKKLDSLEASLSQYKLAHNGELPEQEGTLGAALGRLQTQLENNRDAANRAAETKAMLTNNLSTVENAISMINNALADNAAAPAAAGSPKPVGAPKPSESELQISSMEKQLAALRLRYGDLYPDVRKLQGQIDQLKADAAKQEPAQVDTGQEGSASQEASTSKEATSSQEAELSQEDATKPSNVPATSAPATKSQPKSVKSVVASVQTSQQIAALKLGIDRADKELEFRKKEEAQIVESMNQIQRRLNNLPVREQEMAQITRDYEISKENYKSLLDKKISAEMASDMEQTQKSERFQVLDPARVPEKPFKPKRGMLDAMGCLVALAVGLLLGFGWEYKQNLFLGEWELPAHVPVLARIPHMDNL
jgi:polysaccharide biosynthesis transport protein